MPRTDANRVVQVVAHRGASEDVPEHTLAAYRKAIDDGADALECDVRLTLDGVLVCVHDRRIDRTSSGRGAVSALELVELAELDFGSWQDVAGLEEPDADRSGVLTHARLVELVRDCERPVQLAIETKHPTRYAGLVERALVDLLTRYGLAGPNAPAEPRVRVMSFAWTSLRRISALAPELPTVLLMRQLPATRRNGSLPSRVSVAGPSIDVLRRHPGYVRRVHDRGHPVHVWTVNRPEDVDLALDLEVDALITDRPSAVREVLRRRAGELANASRR